MNLIDLPRDTLSVVWEGLDLEDRKRLTLASKATASHLPSIEWPDLYRFCDAMVEVRAADDPMDDVSWHRLIEDLPCTLRSIEAPGYVVHRILLEPRDEPGVTARHTFTSHGYESFEMTNVATASKIAFHKADGRRWSVTSLGFAPHIEHMMSLLGRIRAMYPTFLPGPVFAAPHKQSHPCIVNAHL